VGIDATNSRVVGTTSIGGSGLDYGSGIAVDSQGNVYLAGSTCSPDFPGVEPSEVGPASVAAFVVKLAPGLGTRLLAWSAVGATAGFAVDSVGNFAVVRIFGTFNPAYIVYLDYIDPSGKLVWTTEGAVPVGPGLAMDAQGRIYTLTGWGGTPGAWQSSMGAVAYGLRSAALIRIEPRGGLLTVLPETIDLTYPSGTGPLVAVAGGMALPAPFSVSTSTPWIGISNSGPAVVWPLPNWMSMTPPGYLSIEASSNLAPGTYDGSITITAPGYANSPLTVPVHLTTPIPATYFPPDTVLFCEGTYLTLYQAQSGQTITTSTNWIDITPDGKTALVDCQALPAGVNEGQIGVSVLGDPSSPYTLAVTAVTGAFQPVNPSAAPGSVSFLAKPGDSPKHATVALWRPGGDEAGVRQRFTATSEASWLSVAPGVGAIPQVLALTADPSGLQTGTYQTHIDVTANQATNGGLRIPVNMTVQNSVPFNVDPAAVGLILPGYAPPGGPGPQIALTLSSAQPVTYNTSDESYTLCDVYPQTGTAPGTLTLAFEPCSGEASAETEYLSIVTSNNNMAEVPIAILNPGLFPLIEPGGGVNGATFAPGPVAPGSIVSIFGVDLSASVYTATSLPLAGAGGLQVSIYPYIEANFRAFYESPQQWNVQVPFTFQGGTYQVAIGNSEFVNFTVAPTAPYVFIWNGNRAAALNADFTLNQPSNPAAAGSSIMVYLTGQGAVDPPVNDGAAAPARPLSKVIAATTATIDGQPAEVLFSGLAPGLVGAGQVNVGVPSNLPAGEHELVISIGGVNSNQAEISTK